MPEVVKGGSTRKFGSTLFSSISKVRALEFPAPYRTPVPERATWLANREPLVFHAGESDHVPYRNSLQLLWRHLDPTQRRDFQEDRQFTCWAGPQGIMVSVRDHHNAAHEHQRAHILPCNCGLMKGMVFLARLDNLSRGIYGLCIHPRDYELPAGDVALMHKLAFEHSPYDYFSVAREAGVDYDITAWVEKNPGWEASRTRIQWPKHHRNQI